MSIINKSMEQLREAKIKGQIVSMWGTATMAYAIVEVSETALEMWRVTP